MGTFQGANTVSQAVVYYFNRGVSGFYRVQAIQLDNTR